MNEKVKELRELKRLAEELQAEIEGLQDIIKGEMTAQDVDTLTGADWKVTWKLAAHSPPVSRPLHFHPNTRVRQ